jgi:hypothetical protein
MVRRQGRRGWAHKQPQGGLAAELVVLAVTIEGHSRPLVRSTGCSRLRAAPTFSRALGRALAGE